MLREYFNFPVSQHCMLTLFSGGGEKATSAAGSAGNAAASGVKDAGAAAHNSVAMGAAVAGVAAGMAAVFL